MCPNTFGFKYGFFHINISIISLVIIMQVESAPVIPPECHKIIERIFVFVDTKDPKLNIELQLAVNP